MNRALLKKSVELLDAGVPHAVATIASAKGSVPGKPGASMIVTLAGEFFGTVGGAGLEEKTKALAIKALREGKGGIHRFDLAYYKEGALDSLCGGSVEVFIEVMNPVPHVLICGGGHVGLEVAKLCDQLGYGHSVLDERADYASAARFPNARQHHVSSPDAFFASADLKALSHLLIVGHSHHTDTNTLHHALKRFEGWIGNICSKMKRKEMFMRLKARGATDAELARVEAPVGLDIGAETPAEIAVAILGSIIRRHKGADPGAVGERSDVQEEAGR
jgi:xanthine dehydrogenase accessory factor